MIFLRLGFSFFLSDIIIRVCQGKSLFADAISSLILKYQLKAVKMAVSTDFAAISFLYKDSFCRSSFIFRVFPGGFFAIIPVLVYT